ncbi:MAG: hypothetical protein JWO94_2466 [Verrucomicrobiaceae bacterium]|nr:hypothetical protein [Verrucomicrobiaceae bacterium]
MNITHRTLTLAAALLPIAAYSLPPESPALWREVTGVIHDTRVTPATTNFTRPHQPAWRTSADGRIGLIVEGGGAEGGTPRFGLFMPEKMATQPFLNNPAGSFTMSSTSFKWLDGYSSPSAASTQFTLPNTSDGIRRGVSHAALWETAPPTAVLNATTGLYEDVYTLKIFGSTNWTATVAPTSRTQFFVTPIKIFVQNPKTLTAAIRSIVRDTSAPNAGATVGGPEYPFQGNAFEPLIVGDGHLLITRVGSPSLGWTDPVTGTVHAGQGCDIVYSYYAAGGAADPTLWTNIIPISHAPFDSRINTKFGFAMAQFRDPEGTLIPDGEDIGGSYPWMDREARNLFFETVFDQLHYAGSDGVWNQSRYPQTGVPEETPTYKPEDGGKHQGISFAGLWSHGKVVMIDNAMNDVDYAIGAGDNADPLLAGPEQRMVQLYQASTGPLGTENGWLRMSYGRSTLRMPLGENDNANIIESLENQMNYRKYVKPISVRDVAWPMTVGKNSDEMSFDDYVDPDSFIIANMTGLLTFVNNGTGGNYFTHWSGWNGTTHVFSNAVKLQNAATAPATRWITPKNGLVVGPGRLEPAATGGVHGKGFWMDGTVGLEFTVPTQPAGVNVSASDWYAGVFVDCRHTDDTVERRLATFPDGTIVSIVGRHQILYTTAAGAVVNRISLPIVLTTTPVTALNDLLPDTAWAHLAFQIRKAGTEVDFHLNGLIYNRYSDPYTPLFQMTAGKLTLGRPASTTITGFNGWLDDFKVIAHAVDLETACNHANGTLIGLPGAYTADWKTKFADRFPSWTHDEITRTLKANGEATYVKYACLYNYQQDNAANLFTIPSGTVSLRNSIHFPEGPLLYNKPRPHSVQNQFCVTCHKTPGNGVGNGGLDLDALAFDSTYTADQDPRRQPTQPPRRIYGQIPAGLVDTTGLPSAATTLTAAGQLIDQWMLGAFGGATAVQTYTIVDADTGKDLADLVNSGTVDPAKLGNTNLTIRANLDSAQGYVNMQYDTSAVNQRLLPPYAAFGTGANPLAGQVLLAGAHSVKATPQYGVLNTLNFTVVRNTSRIVAGYRTDYKTHSPLPGWSYHWNANGPVTSPANYVNMAWTTGASKYSGKGSVIFPEAATDGSYVSLTPTGGHPGRGTTQGQTNDRFAIAAYTVKLAGYYGISNGFVTSSTATSNGGQVIVYTETNAGASFTQKLNGTYVGGGTLNITALNVGQLQAGDTIYVCVGPNTVDGSDSFSIDFSIYCNEIANPL